MAKKKKRKKRKKAKAPQAQITHPRKEAKPKAPTPKPKLNKYILAGPLILLLAAAAYILLIRPAAYDKITKDSGLNVLLVTLDTTRADRLGCYGYTQAKTPNLDYLAAQGVMFSKAACQVPLTSPSHCSILTGTYPLFHGVRNNGTYTLSPELQTLAEVLKAKQRQTAAFVGSFSVDSRFGLDQGFDVYDDQFVPDQAFKALNSERRADAVYASFARWMDEHRSSPFFSWIHFFDPHIPYDPPPPFREQFFDAPYDGEIAFMDHTIGKIVDTLRSYGLLENTLIVLAGDHGEAFGEQDEKGHGVFIYESTMQVPLILYAPNSLPQGKIIDARVRLIDLMPTILDLLEVPPPTDIQGESLLPYIEGKKKQDLTSYIESYYPRENYGWSELVGLIDGGWKYIKAPREELYHLDQDPQESHDLSREEKKILQDKRDKLADIIKTSTAPLLAQKKTLTTEERDRLRSLGYISMPGSPAQGELPDPKDRKEEMRLIQEAEAYEIEEKFQEAAAVHEKILELRPDVALSYINLALMKARLMEMDETIRILEQGLEMIPDSEVLLSRLGHTFMVTGKVRKALDTFDRILKFNPRFFDALLGSAWILNLMGQSEDAQGYYREALQIEPENKFARKNYALSLASSGKIAPALEIYNSLKLEYPDDPEILKELGIAYGYAGDISQSIENLEKSVSLQPDPLTYLNLAVAQRKVGNLEESVRYLKLYLANPEGQSEENIAQARAELQNLERILKR